MKNIFKLIIITLVAFSCETKNNDIQSKIDTKTSKVDSTSLKMLEVESLIQEHDPIFLSAFWIGMNEKQYSDVIEYLLKKGQISGEIKNNIPIGLNYELSPKNKSIHFKINLSFFENKEGKFLKSINLAASDDLDSTSVYGDVDYSDYNDLVLLYKKKYGDPINVSNKSFKGAPKGLFCKNHYFQKENKLIVVSFRDEYKEKVDVFNVISAKQILINYNDKIISDSISDSNNDIKNQNQKKYLESINTEIIKNRKKSLDKI